MVDEVVFVTGPALVTFLSTVYAPQAGLVVAVVAGTVGLAGTRRATPDRATGEPTRPNHGQDGHAMGMFAAADASAPPLWAPCSGALEVASVAFADDAGHKALAGLMLGAFSLGSLLAGVAAGAIIWQRGPLERGPDRHEPSLRWARCSLPILPGLVVVTTALFLTGLALAPTLIALFSLIEASVPRCRLNEAMGFVQTGMSAGIAPGAWLAGVCRRRARRVGCLLGVHGLRRSGGARRVRRTQTGTAGGRGARRHG